MAVTAGGVSLDAITRPGAVHPPRGTAHVVFDKSGDTYFLSEIWLPDQDGWLVYVTSGKHSHRIVQGSDKG